MSDYCNFIESLETSEFKSFNFVFLFQNCFFYFELFAFLYKF